MFRPVERAPALSRDLKDRVGTTIDVEAAGQDVPIQYPRAFSLAVIQPQIRLEIGPLASWLPNEEREIRPYAADHLPQLFSRLGTSVRTIMAVRTFWEKATILHQEAHRSAEKRLPPNYSRHYYDLYRLSRLPGGNEALANPGLLHEVARLWSLWRPLAPIAIMDYWMPQGAQARPRRLKP